MSKPPKLRDYAPETDTMMNEVLEGLQKPVKELSAKFFYDERGSRLFDKITELKEYYPTRTEIAIMSKYIDEMASFIGPDAMLIEYGSGSSEKTTILLDHLDHLSAYVPIDISKDHLMKSAEKIAKRYPDVEVSPVCADYNDKSFSIPTSERRISHRVVYYPGSTIGNFHPHEAVGFMERIARVCGAHGGLLIGVDLKKSPAILRRAYNDDEGVTAEFNLNVLRRINTELGANFRIDGFRHRAIYDDTLGRIEMHLVSLEDQSVQIDDVNIDFKEGESIWTESSYKYAIDEFASLAAEADFTVERVWTDENQLFSVQYLETR